MVERLLRKLLQFSCLLARHTYTPVVCGGGVLANGDRSFVGEFTFTFAALTLWLNKLLGGGVVGEGLLQEVLDQKGNIHHRMKWPSSSRVFPPNQTKTQVN